MGQDVSWGVVTLTRIDLGVSSRRWLNGDHMIRGTSGAIDSGGGCGGMRDCEAVALCPPSFSWTRTAIIDWKSRKRLMEPPRESLERRLLQLGWLGFREGRQMMMENNIKRRFHVVGEAGTRWCPFRSCQKDPYCLKGFHWSTIWRL